MVWTQYTVIYELRSPLHIGYHKVGNVQRTRYYIPARNLWGAVTETLTRRGFSTNGVTEGNYQQIGAWVKEHCAFGYWFIQENGKWLYPRHDGNCLKYGHLTTTDFELRYLDAHVTTALDPSTTSAEEGSLHEVEFISPYNPVKPDKTEAAKPTRIGGWVFLDDNAMPLLGEESKWRTWLGDLQIGGERRYGFGMLRLLKIELANESQIDPTGIHPRQYVPKGTTLLAHTVIAPSIRIRGQIEPLVGRATSQSHTFGLDLTRGIVCWTPGSVPMDDVKVQFEPEGHWCVV